jgi:hypothetical protein
MDVADCSRGDMKRLGEEGSKHDLKVLLTHNKVPKVLGGMKVKM